jgi:predicted CoA-binding protein
MTDARQILEEASSVLLVDWPSTDVPDTLVRAGFQVTVKGQERAEYLARELSGNEISERPAELPAKVDLFYVHRPVDELPGIVMMARTLGAQALWYQSGRTEGGASDPKGCWLPEDEAVQARRAAESAELAFVGDAYIADVVREAAIQK